MLEIKDLYTNYIQSGKVAAAVRGVSITVAGGSSVALVGESGSGKSTVALSAMRMVGQGSGQIASGTISVGGVDITHAPDKQVRSILRTQIGFIPQDPSTALDPLFTVRSQIREALPAATKRKSDELIVELLESLGIVDADRRLKDYPHQFSGGMRQRVAIAIALAKKPTVLIADEPTTALDVTTQIGILRLLDRLRVEHHLATLFITHNMRVARLLCQSAVVMYGGIVVESGPMAAMMEGPSHPYTRALIDANSLGDRPRAKLRAIPGSPPSLLAMPRGCPFAPRCSNATVRCAEDLPVPVVSPAGTTYSCWNPVTR